MSTTEERTSPTTATEDDDPRLEQIRGMRILIVEDMPSSRELVERVLSRDGFTALRATDEPTLVPDLCEFWQPDLILLDFHLPGWSGLDVLERIRHLTMRADVGLPVIVITADTTRKTRHDALRAGARDFLTKPIDQIELLLRVQTHLLMRHLQKRAANRNDELGELVRDRTMELERSRVESLTILASVSEYHDDDTAQHTQRVGVAASLLAGALGQSAAYVAQIRDAAPLHDIGKIAIDRSILQKPGKLTEAERAEMQQHVRRGAAMLSSARSPVLRMAREIAASHHEHWNGNGYLDGLEAEAIPLAGRITAVVDVYDALTHARPYKPAWEIPRALELIGSEAGAQFDPAVVRAFLDLAHAGVL
jgi:putative two-component system response regulator